ncbi:DUF721 domain-containing protein [Desulfovibrio ferrophilus]|uniref:DUF721 domain-containing protein n=1 Tax=Desulfovibrio ferrophilus TaxID=241368 RepID=A0A2Z6B267_9BACT|nr:DUF721 domain-containing protein [Desulfovibrio ferrophilus]BBD09609.1 uncharacterized protein DFE_2883 [Desulfovibrio ferrophilus]
MKRMKRFSSALTKLLQDKDGEGTHYHLTRLWKHWEEVVGDHIAEVARPLGHRKTTLLIGVEDHMLMQELVHYSPAILEQVNTFLGMNFFDKVHVDLIGDHVSLDALPENTRQAHPLEPQKPEQLGGLVGKLDPDSPMAKCYRAYVEYFARREQARKGRDTPPSNSDHS